MTQRRILIYHIGSLGDTLVAVPALWAVLENYPDAHITMLTDEQPGRTLVQTCNILDGSGLVDDYIFYPVGNLTAMARLLLRIRSGKFDSLVYMVRATANDRRVLRDKRFFRLAGIKRVLGTQGLPVAPEISKARCLPRLPHVTDTLLRRLAASGLHVPPEGDGKMEIGIGVREMEKVEQWLSDLPSSEGRRWIGVGIGGKMAAKRWPIERYAALVARLVETDDVWPVVFGGPEDRANGQRLVEHWKRGYVACGALGVREAIAAIARCSLFAGNDTGTIHMAATAGVRCVGVYSSRDFPGLWDPYGKGHVVFRTAIPCEGCLLEECVEQRTRCILSISVERVLAACQDVLRATSAQYECLTRAC
ncbi:MAG: glycosyltransferase family 9 protein [Planctomycetes bacterium]|nr:glycosyltransferase family 9 protein [Planctomycetota bacterium]MBU4398077.1 glycosyltransferase family 9 protein [Planctomycetota bacterium]MCG2682831.1 glycosyltransferase family 9 protein [Planctomycetales bacterium]